MKNEAVRRIVTNAVLLAMFCVINMFSINFANNTIKVSLQLLFVFILNFYLDNLADKLIVIGAYILLGLFLPIYAGFSAGFSPTWGFVAGFIIAIIPAHFILKINRTSFVFQLISSLILLAIVYACGAAFMAFYLAGKMSVGEVILISILPYIPFDAVKIGIALILDQKLFSKVRKSN